MAVMATSAGSTAGGPGAAMTASQSTVPKLEGASQRLDYTIKYSLDKFQYRTALFLAERLLSQTRGVGHSEAEREYAQYLVATCHYRQGKPEMAWAILEGCTSLRCRYLFAQCCLDLRRYVECNGVLEWLLEDTALTKCPAIDVITNRGSNSGEPDRASVLNLLGHTARAQQRHKLAVKYFKEALELNPFLWEAFECLCELGVPPDPNTTFAQFDFRMTSILPRTVSTFQRPRTINMETSIFSTSKHDTMQDENVESASTDSSSILNNPLTKTRSGFLPPLLSTGISSLGQMNDSDSYGIEKTPTPLGSSNNRELSFAAINTTTESTERVPLKRGAAIHTRRHFERAKSNTSLQAHGSSGGITKRGLEKSTSVTSFAASGLLRGAKGRSQLKLGTSFGSKKDAASNDDREQTRESTMSMVPSPGTEVDPWAEEEALRTVADILRIMARAYGLFSISKFSESLAEFERLPFEHLQSGWVQCQMAKCKFEMHDHSSAAQHFERARELEPSIQRDMEIYSTCLWHLRKEMVLSTLAKELKDANHLSPQAWLALGNAYSLKHESEQALKCFQRAIQLNDRFAYAHTLAGLEYIELEEYDKAQTEFRAGMSIDPRHYHAWYGMSRVYDKMGKHDLALIHAKEAYKLSPSNNVLLYHVGAIQQKMNRTTEALRTFEEAISLSPGNVAARYQKALIQAEMGQYDEALSEIEVVKKMTPNEPNVFVLQGRVMLKLGDNEQALKYFTWALNLDSKSSHAIRDLIEKVHQDSDHDQESYEVKVDTDQD